MGKVEIALFVPEKTRNQPLDIFKLNAMMGKKFQYAAKGRYAIEHILKEYCGKGKKVLLPAYFCSSVLEVLSRLGLSYEFYDLDITDLNPSASSIEKVLNINSHQICAVIVPSFYGNPADLSAIWEVCKKYEVVMLDDAAQSFGSILDGKYVGNDKIKVLRKKYWEDFFGIIFLWSWNEENFYRKISKRKQNLLFGRV